MSRNIPLGGYRVVDARKAPLARLLKDRVRRGVKTTVFFANANFITRCQHLKRAADRPDVLVVSDGIAVAAAARVRHGVWFRDNLNGTDFVPYLLGQLPPGSRLALAGGSAAAADGAARVFGAAPNIEVVDVRDGFSGIRAEDALEAINAARPDVLLVAMGNPLQEEWILKHRDQLDVPLVLAVGALFDFAAGLVKRAPILVRRLRMEWAFRLLQEPRRLLKRYTLDTARFFVLVWAHPHRPPRSTSQ